MTLQKTILVATANPDDSEQIRTDRFISAIQKGLSDAQKLKEYKIEYAVATNLADFFKKIELFKPDILVLVGHGDELDRFVFETTNGGREFAKSTAFANTLALYAETLESVLVMACHSQSLAQKITQYIPYAVGYEDTLQVTVAKEYIENFFFYLANGNDYNTTNQRTSSVMQNKIAKDQIPQLFVKAIIDNQNTTHIPKNMNKEQIITLIENNKLDEAFKQFISLARGTELYTNFLMPLYIEYQEYLDDKLAGKNVSGKLADISQRLMRILEKYQETISSNPINTNTNQNNTNMMDKKALKEEILALIESDIDIALEKLDDIFGKSNGDYNDLSDEYQNPPVGFSLKTFRSRLKRFINTTKYFL